FEQLISISGVGPKVALAVMGALDYGSLTRSIAGGRSDVLRKVPGIGQKTAERIVLELRDKVQPPAGGIEAPGATSDGPQPDAETVAALVGLGYTQAEASAAAAAVAADAPLEERVREALSFFART
ncbi:MAG: Holliday junction branch migration protein RuvA, partial [Chloroflexi bacterium]|nr:Holliday junction branch migration protein RuvA [Chloroflexota bacterium]